MFRVQRKAQFLSVLMILCLVTLSVNEDLSLEDTDKESFRYSENIIPGFTYTDHAAIVINDDADFASQGWPGSGVIEEPYIIEGLSFVEGNDACISISDTTVYFEVRDCYFERSEGLTTGIGIILENVANGNVIDCIMESLKQAIRILDSRYCIIMRNTVSRSWGISLENSSNCTLKENTVEDNTYGHAIHLLDSFNCTLDINVAKSSSQGGCKIENVTNSILTRNTAHDNTYFGFHISDSANCTFSLNSAYNNHDPGFTISRSFNCTMSNNTSSHNTNGGISLPSSTNCTLTYNRVFSNSYYGIDLGFDSEYNRVYLNRIDTNGEGTAKDDGDSNWWDDGISHGNYWRDYDGNGY